MFPRRRLQLIAGLVLAVSLALTGCSSGGGQAKKNPASQAKQKWTIHEQSGFKFSPSKITVKKGQPVTLTMINDDKIKHNITIDAFKVSEDQDPGQTNTVTFTPDKTGTFQFYCDVPGHKAAGMVGTLVVTD